MPYLPFLLALAFAISPVFSSFDGFDPGLYPIPQDDPPVQPAGWAFSIWGPIYLWLIVATAFGAWKRSGAPDWSAHRVPLSISLAVGAIWLSVAQVSPVWATVLIWIMLGSAATAYLRTPRRDRWLASAPVGLYAGWLTAASSVSLGLLGAGYGLMGQIAAAWASLALTLALGFAIQMVRGSVTYPFAIAWAAAAISAQNAGASLPLTVAAGVGCCVMAGLAAREFTRT